MLECLLNPARLFPLMAEVEVIIQAREGTSQAAEGDLLDLGVRLWRRV